MRLKSDRVFHFELLDKRERLSLASGIVEQQRSLSMTRGRSRDGIVQEGSGDVEHLPRRAHDGR